MEPARLPYELERGKPAPGFNHSVVQSNIGSELMCRLGQTHTVVSEINLDLNGHRMVPDLAVFSKRPLDMQHDVLWVQEVPLATVDILTLNQDLEALLARASDFLVAGVRSCWVVLPGIGKVAVFTGPSVYRTFAHGSVEAVRDEVLGVEIPLAELFG